MRLWPYLHSPTVRTDKIEHHTAKQHANECMSSGAILDLHVFLGDDLIIEESERLLRAVFLRGDTRFMSDWNMYDTLPEGDRNNNNNMIIII